MPAQLTTAQSEAARLNGAKSAGPVTDAGKARSTLNATRHGLCSRTFFLLPDEDPDDYARYEAMWLHTLNPHDLPERDAALTVIHARWREMRADRLEAHVLADLFAAGDIADEVERAAAKHAAMRALATLIRYRARVQREHDRAMATLDALKERPPGAAAPARTNDPEPLPAAAPPPHPPAREAALVRNEPTPAGRLNRHQHRALAAQARMRAA